MTELRVLVVDDVVEERESLADTLGEADGDSGWNTRTCGFNEVATELGQFRPDLVVLDLIEGAPEGDSGRGNDSFDEIRQVWFCPVVVHSAFPDRQRFELPPLVETVQKGKGSDEEVARRLNELAPYAVAVRSVHRDFDRRIREALRDSVAAMHPQLGSAADGQLILQRAVRRVVAARTDLDAGDEQLRSWERFVIPPLGDHLLTADILRKATETHERPHAFRVVLTPSCDLVPRGDRGIAADRVLVARCEPLTGFGKMQLPPGKVLSSKHRNRLRRVLTQGMADGLIPIPAFHGQVPLMVANLKRLDLLTPKEIAHRESAEDADPSETEYVRVASTDSPFREMVVWAYLRTTGRPGLPDIDIDNWLEDISADLASRRPA